MKDKDDKVCNNIWILSVKTVKIVVEFRKHKIIWGGRKIMTQIFSLVWFNWSYSQPVIMVGFGCKKKISHNKISIFPL